VVRRVFESHVVNYGGLSLLWLVGTRWLRVSLSLVATSGGASRGFVVLLFVARKASSSL